MVVVADVGVDQFEGDGVAQALPGAGLAGDGGRDRARFPLAGVGLGGAREEGLVVVHVKHGQREASIPVGLRVRVVPATGRGHETQERAGVTDGHGNEGKTHGRCPFRTTPGDMRERG